MLYGRWIGAIFAAMIKLGLLREGKVPKDSRAVLSPEQMATLQREDDGLRFVVQPSEIRCFQDAEYEKAGISLQEDLSDCDILLGVKEVPVKLLQDNKTYFFFSHTIKKQPHNRDLLRAVLQKNIRLIDWETLTDDQDRRVIAFGRWAGIVGGHNALWTWGKRSDKFHLPRAYECRDYAALLSSYRNLSLPPFKTVIAGGGRVAKGAEEVLRHAGVELVSPEAFLQTKKPDRAIYTMLDCPDFYRRTADGGFEWSDFFKHPSTYESSFAPYLAATDLLINAIYWDPAAPRFFTREQMKASDFRIRVIADITCDIDGSIPTTVKATTISEPLFGTELLSGAMSSSLFGGQILTTMSIDNLPNELPRDASEAFGRQFGEKVWPEIRKPEQSAMLARACIARDGALTPRYAYLQDYVEGQPLKT